MGKAELTIVLTYLPNFTRETILLGMINSDSTLTKFFSFSYVIND